MANAVGQQGAAAVGQREAAAVGQRSAATSEFVTRYAELFQAREDTYAIRIEGRDRAIYVPSTYAGDSEWTHEKIRPTLESLGSDYTPEVVHAHLRGEAFLGIYPIRADSTVRLFCLDFDGDSPEEAWGACKAQYRVLTEEAGLPHLYLERSRSGNGWHIWGFLDEPVNAGRLRHALKPFLLETDTYDRMFPNQDGVDPALPLGNLVALPLFGPAVKEGKGSFVEISPEGEPETVANQREYLYRIQRLESERIEELFTEAKESYREARPALVRTGDPEGLPGAWKVVHKVFGCEWMRWCYEHPEEVGEPEWWCLAHQFAQLEGGRALFHEWSRQDPARYNVRDTDRKFDQALARNAPPRCGYIREQLQGPPCLCDQRFPGVVNHPYELARVESELIMQSVKEEQRVHTATEGFRLALDWAKAVHKNPEEGAGIRYGLPSLDAVTRLRNSELVLFAGRPGSGKTAASLWAGHNIARRGVPVYFFSLEMSHEQLWKRQICCAAGVDQTRMATGTLTYSDWRKLHRAKEEIERGYYPFFVDDVTNHTGHILDVAGELSVKYGKGVVVVDYLQLAAKLPKETTYDKVSRVGHELKGVAKALDMPVLALTQMNRAADDVGTDAQTSDSWLRGCLTADTRILRADTNTYAPIGALAASGERDIPVWSMAADGTMQVRTMTHAFSSGEKQVYRMRLRSGREIRATDNHPFLTLSGWEPLGQLRQGSRIAIPRKIGPAQGASALTEPEIILLAHLLGDGCVGGKNRTVRYATASEENLRVVRACAEELFDVRVVDRDPERKVTGTHQLTFSSKERLSRRRRNPLTVWLERLGVLGCLSPDKFVPDEVFSLPDEGVALFLRHLWATDGCLRLNTPPSGRGKSRVTAYYSTNSRRLADDVATLLLRFGIVARIARVPQGEYRDGYMVRVQGNADLQVFLDRVGTFGPKREQETEIRAWLAGSVDNTNVDTIPQEVWGHLRSVAAAQERSWKEVTVAARGYWTGKSQVCPSRRLVWQYANVLQDERASCLAQSDLFWDEVAEITPEGVEEVFDATVPGTHNFVADGIVVHNSGELEQVADVVIFMLGEKGRGVKERNLVVHKERHRESGIRVVAEFNQPLMQFGDAGTWLHAPAPIFHTGAPGDAYGAGGGPLDPWTAAVSSLAGGADPLGWGL